MRREDQILPYDLRSASHEENMEEHIKKKISAFLDNELPVEEQKEVGEHLMNCGECRKEHDLIRFGMDFAGSLQEKDAPPAVWRNIKKETGNEAGAERRTASRKFLKPILAFACAVIAMLLFVPLFIYLSQPAEEVAGGPGRSAPDPSAWRIQSASGDPSLSEKVGKVIEDGTVIQTLPGSSATLSVADIGKVDVAPNSKVRLIRSSSKEQRMALEKGKLTAEIKAPPRLFIVDTPTAAAVDLGCAYTLEVDEDGSSRLQVTSGYVALETGDLESFVPAGAFCESRKGKRLGTPYFADAAAELKTSLAEFDFGNGGSDAVDTIIRESKRKDTLTLWHLLAKVSEDERPKLIARIVQEVELDDGVTIEGLLRLDREMMMELRSDLEVLWYEQPGWFD